MNAGKINPSIYLILALCIISIVLTLLFSSNLGILYSASLLIIFICIVFFSLTYPSIFSLQNFCLVSFLIHFQFIFLIIPSLILTNEIKSIFAARATLAVGLSVFLESLAAIITNHAQSKNVFDWVVRSIDKKHVKSMRLLLAILIVISAITMIYFIIKTPEVPLFRLFSIDASIDIITIREESFKLLNIPLIFKYLIEWVRCIFWPFLTGVMFSRLLIKKSKKRIFAFMVFFVIGIIITGFTTEKAIVTNFILINILIYIFIKQKKLKARTILLGGIISLSFPLLIFYIRAVSSKIGYPLQFAFYSLFNRIFMVPARVAMVHYMVFPDYINFLYGSSMNYISYFLGKELFPLSNYLYLYFYPWGAADNPSGFLNATYTSEMWANFGWFGIMLSAIFLGFFLHSVNLWVWKLKKTPEIISIYSVMLASVLNLISGNVTVFLLSKGFIILYFFTLLGNMTLIKTRKDNSQIINRSLKCL